MNVCRICLNPKPRKNLTQLTLQRDHKAKKHDYEEIMEFCLGIKVTEDATTMKLCVKCFNKLLDFYQFKALAIKNDAHLRSELQNDAQVDTIVKVEYSEVDVRDYELNGDDEPLVYVKEECEQKDLSENELHNVLKDIKHDSDNEGDSLLENKESVLKKPKLKVRPNLKAEHETTIGTQNIVKKEQKTKEKVDIKLELKICDLCGKEVKHLKHHLLSHRPTETRPKFECDMCGTVMLSKVTLKRHIRVKHNINALKKCHICGNSVKHLTQHIKRIHNRDTLPFVCIACNKRFASKSALGYHTTLHTKERPYECDICHKKYRWRENLNLHKREVHEKKKSHMCQFCSKPFGRKKELLVHIRSHTNERPYECSECNKKFVSTDSLRKHRLIHIGEKKYHCTMCSKSFVLPSYLRMHIANHIKEKKFQCQYCDAKFHRSDHRKRHEFTAHFKHSKHSVNKVL